MLITDANFHPIAYRKTGTGGWPNSVNQSRVNAYPPLSNQMLSSRSWAIGRVVSRLLEEGGRKRWMFGWNKFRFMEEFIDEFVNVMINGWCISMSFIDIQSTLRDDYKWMSARACATGRFYGWRSALINCFDSLLVLLNKIWDLQCDLGLCIHQQRYRYYI